MRGIASFNCNILVAISVQLCATTALATGKYSILGLVFERMLSGQIEAVWTCSRIDKYLASGTNLTTILQALSPVLFTILRVSRLT